MDRRIHLLVSLLLAAGLWACPSNKPPPEGEGEGDNNGSPGGSNGDNPGGNPGGDPGGGTSTTQKEENLPNWGLGADGSLALGVTMDGVDVAGDGDLVLQQSTGKESRYMWLADTVSGNADTEQARRGMVSKFDMETGKEVARYYSVTNIRCAAGQSPAKGECTTLKNSFTLNNYYPSRTAIDSKQDAWIANRGGNNRPGVLTKIAGDESRCVDRNGNGRIDTSRVVNGVVQMVEDDECVLFSTPVCPGSYSRLQGARALAVDGADRAWVGCYQGKAAYQFNAINGVEEQGPIPLGLEPYGAIVDSRQTVWMTTRAYYNNATYPTYLQGIRTAVPYDVNAPEKTILGWDSANNKPAPMAPKDGNRFCAPYGIAIDGADRVWFGGWNESGIVACFYNHYAPAGGTWKRCTLSADGFNQGRGVAVDKEGHVYLSSNTSGRLTRFRWNEQTETCDFAPMKGPGNTTLKTVHLDIGNTLLGVGFDKEGNPWTIAEGSRAARLNLKTGEILRTTPTKDHSPHYYTYSDFTGYQMINYTAPEGRYTRIIEGCPNDSSWKSLSWTATLPPPAAGSPAPLEVFVRIGRTRDELFSPWVHTYGPYGTSPVDLSQLPKSSFLELEFVLRPGENKESPRLHGYELEWVCEKPKVSIG